MFYWAVEMSEGRETDKWSLNEGRYLLAEHPKYAAPTASELGERLPRVCYSFKPLHSTRNWVCYWQVEGGLRYKPHQLKRLSFHADTEINARAKMWLYLKKHNLLEEEE